MKSTHWISHSTLCLMILISGGGLMVSGCASAEKPLGTPTKVLVPSRLEGPVLTYDEKMLDNSGLEFIEHKGPGFSSYLAMNIHYGPVRGILAQLERHLGRKLKGRPEAHITVVTPPEYANILAPHLSIDEIHRIARNMRIQQAKFEILCLGRGSAKVGPQEESTYYVVVYSPDLAKIRKAIQDQFEFQGGRATAFNPHHFYPHITVGFTKSDIHEDQGVIKGESSCWAPMAPE